MSETPICLKSEAGSLYAMSVESNVEITWQDSRLERPGTPQLWRAVRELPCFISCQLLRPCFCGNTGCFLSRCSFFDLHLVGHHLYCQCGEFSLVLTLASSHNILPNILGYWKNWWAPFMVEG